jgi:chemotaxis protein MotA
MAWSTGAGLVLAFVVLIGTVLIEGGQPAALLNAPAALVVFGGTFVTALISFTPARTLGVVKMIIQIFKFKAPSHDTLISQIVDLADKARRQGLLALDEEVNQLEEPFLKKGLQMVVDGTDPEMVRKLLEIETHHMLERHKGGQAVLAAMGGYAPTMGIIGTVMGLVNVLSHMDNPEHLASSIATAFLATLYGVASANLIWLPLGSNLAQVDEEELLMRSITTEGVLAIQAGDNPRIVGSKLEAFLSPIDRKLEPEDK